jgi:hypothetical protein
MADKNDSHFDEDSDFDKNQPTFLDYMISGSVGVLAIATVAAVYFGNGSMKVENKNIQEKTTRVIKYEPAVIKIRAPVIMPKRDIYLQELLVNTSARPENVGISFGKLNEEVQVVSTNFLDSTNINYSVDSYTNVTETASKINSGLEKIVL